MGCSRGPVALGVTGGLLIAAGVVLTVFCALALQQNQTQYAIMMDAGSSGTRAYVYSWERLRSDRVPHDYPQGANVYRISPGVSTLSNSTAAEVAEYFEPLLNFTRNTVPASQHSRTPIFLRATAGMRLLPADQVDPVLDRIRDVFAASPFDYEASRVSVISGNQEALYAWLSVNAKLDRLSPSTPIDDTVGTLELGGASAQIAFVTNDSSVPHELLTNVSLPSNPDTVYPLYTVSFLTWGLNQALLRMESALPPAPPNASGSVEMHAQKQPKSYDKYNPCFPAGFISKDGMMGTANFTDCYSRAHQLLHTTAPCESGSCSINGTYQPPLRGAYYALDNYVDRLRLSPTTRRCRTSC
eukprot:TRINITY_DN1161_c0_g1_i1.p1 TRINITY_DN1161_c0_g1~~TRINITY_DN1161_c0_g1_i1.p1  ORF type:complete len:357 (+),score=86.66 TRINITY_DN1161_c0_g1_i1:92-1162(+)